MRGFVKPKEEVKEEAKEAELVAKKEEPDASHLSMEDFTEPLRAAGGPAQYILQECPDEFSVIAMAEKLDAFFEKDPALGYGNKDLFYSAEGETEFICRITDLGFSDESTTKGMPRLHTSLSLVDSIINGGFVTVSDPILAWPNPKTKQKEYFWLSYVKGHNRACTAIAMSIILYKKFDGNVEKLLEVGGQALLVTLRAIRVRSHTVAPDLMAVAFKNALLAHRGSIRKAHDVLSWIQKLEKVSAATGWSEDEVLTKWNQECPTDARVIGAKKVCCLNILKCVNKEGRSLLLAHASKYGENTAFHDDAFSSKKILAGYKPRLPSVKWTRYLSVTHGSFMIMMGAVIMRHESSAETSRTKISKSNLEKLSEQSACVHALVEETQAQYPQVDPYELHAGFTVPFMEGDPNVCLSIESIIMDKAAAFAITDLHELKELIMSLTAGSHVGGELPRAETVKVESTELEKQEFELFKSRIRHDASAANAYIGKTRDRETAMYYKTVQHRVWRAQEAETAAMSLFDPDHVNHKVTILSATEVKHITKTTDKVKEKLAKNSLTSIESVNTFVHINWTAMSLFNAKSTKLQHALLGELVRSTGPAIGMVLLPTFTYKKGFLYKAEAEAQETLGKQGLFIDRSVCLHFSEKPEERSEKPLMVKGTLVLADDNPNRIKSWKGVPAFKDPVVACGAQIRTRDMVTVEDVSLEALPVSIETETHASQAEKHHQLGVPAYLRVLNSMLSDLPGDQRGATMVVDLTLHTGDMLKAFITFNQTFGQQMAYIGMCTDEGQLEFCKAEAIHYTKQRILAGEIAVPNFNIPPAEVPASDNVPEIVKPALVALRWSGEDPIIAEADSKKWTKHEVFAEEFAKVIEKLEDESGFDLINGKKKSVSDDNLTPVKTETGEPPLKVQRTTEPDTFIDEATIETQIIHDVPLTSIGGKARHLYLRVCANNDMYIVNKGTEVAKVQKGGMVAGFSKGKWVNEPSEEHPEKCVKFELADCNSLVLFNARMCRVGALINEKRLTESADETRVCYHNLVESPTDEDHTAFKLNLSQTVYYRLADVQVKEEGGTKAPTQNNVGSTLPPSAWETKNTCICWVMQWRKKKGLQPARPQVCWKASDIDILPGKALQLIQ